MQHSRRLGLSGMAVVLAAFCGCGGVGTELYPVSGKVVYQDGSPLPGDGAVIFLGDPGSEYAVEGNIKSDGTFSLVTIDAMGEQHPGAPAGSYRVFVVSTAEEERDDVPAPPVTSLRYEDPATSGITVEVEPKEMTGIEIKVERPIANERAKELED